MEKDMNPNAPTPTTTPDPSADLSPNKKNGRPPLLDTTKRNEVLAILSLGCSQAVAADYVGCTASTIYRTACRDPEFARRLRHARNQAEVSLLKNIHNAAAADPKFWRAGAWALERSKPGRYGSDRNNPVHPIAPNQLALVLTHFARTILRQVPVDKYQKDIIKSVETMARDLGQPLPDFKDLLEDDMLKEGPKK
jgi:hypothetical protein